VHTDEFLATSRDPRHAAAVSALWRACRQAGDLYTKDYTGLYCPGCEQFYGPDELVDGACAEHRTPAVEVRETNWFFRLSRYREQITELIGSGRLDITPVERRNEVLGFLAGDVHDLSVSRPAVRAAGWGIPVPGDSEQVVYVWFDALTNYLTGLGYGTPDDAAYRRWWAGDAERVHVMGKGIVRFHAVYGIAFLLSAGQPLPTRVLVHDYLTVDGAKIAKSGAQAADPAALATAYGADALRWWLLSDPAPVGTTDFTVERLVTAYNRGLANALGNLAWRALTLSRREGAWRTGPAARVGEKLRTQAAALPAEVDAALAGYDFRAACAAITSLAEAGNRFIEAEEPWHLANAAAGGNIVAAERFEGVIAAVLTVCRVAADELTPFIPDGAARLGAQLGTRTVKPAPAFPRITE
jgi:methionyl-tRNA synthetase